MIYRYSAFALVAFFLLGFDLAPSLSAQGLDTVWQIRYERRIDTRTRKYVLDTLSVWFDERSARQKINDDTYVVIQGDSLSMVDNFHRAFSSGPVAMMDMSWMVNPSIIWRRRRMAQVEVIDSSGTEKIASYSTRPIQFLYHNNAPIPVPMQMVVWATDEVPISREELTRYYELRTLAYLDLAIDHGTINDTLLKRGVLPFKTIADGRVRQPNDTSGVLTVELLSIKRETVPSDFFTPPATYAGMSMPAPTEEQFWELSAVPMPGGPKQ